MTGSSLVCPTTPSAVLQAEPFSAQSFSQSRDIFLQNNIDAYPLSAVDQNVIHGPAIFAGPFYADSESVHMPVYDLRLFRNVPKMHTRAKMQPVASDRARRENVSRHILFYKD